MRVNPCEDVAAFRRARRICSLVSFRDGNKSAGWVVSALRKRREAANKVVKNQRDTAPLPLFRQKQPAAVNPCKAASPRFGPAVIITPMNGAAPTDAPSGAHVLLVDDDVELVELLRAYLASDGFRVSVAHDGASGVRAALVELPDIAVIDVMMPGYSGIEVLRRIRARSTLPVLMLTARGDSESRILGLELGADDYVPKPCTPRELSARLRAILRRTLSKQDADKDTDGDAVRIGELVLLPGQRRITWADETLALTNAEFNLLEVLIQKAGQVVGKDLLSEQGLGRPHERYDRSIDVHVSSIRRKLPPLPDGRSRIQAVFRRGYQLLVD
jgi:two-component system OmpR family response regulator/two-component system response regulator CpxR